jgi:hypothetical protein
MVIGVAALLLIVMSNSGIPKVDDPIPDPLTTAGGSEGIDVALQSTAIQDFSKALSGQDSFNTLVETTTSLYETSKDRNATMVAVSGLLDGLGADKLIALSDMYCTVMTGWTKSFSDITANFLKSNIDGYSNYVTAVSDANQCKKASVQIQTTETNTGINTGTKSNVLGGILFSRGYTTKTTIDQLIKTPVPICSQWGLDESKALALYTGMNAAMKTNYLAWVTSLNSMPTMLSVLGI